MVSVSAKKVLKKCHACVPLNANPCRDQAFHSNAEPASKNNVDPDPQSCHRQFFRSVNPDPGSGILLNLELARW
jgi:hypothetical protein